MTLRSPVHPWLACLTLSACMAASPSEIQPVPATLTEDRTPAGSPIGSAPVGAGSVAEVVAWGETDPVPNDRDAADDIAIWANPDDPAGSLIIGTNKKGQDGLFVYDLAGREIQAVDHGPMNNVDLRDGFVLGDEEIPIVAATAIDNRSLELFRIDPESRGLDPIAGGSLQTGIRSAGVCLYLDDTRTVFAFLTAGSGAIEQWRLFDMGGGTVGGELVRELKVDSRTEGCVADDDRGHLYVSEEATGIWRFDASPSSGTEGELVVPVAEDELVPDVEGLALARAEGTTLLLASSQGDDRIVVYGLDSGRPSLVGSFRVVSDEHIDEVTHTDGVEVSTAPLGTGPFVGGVLVVQDDKNNEPDGSRSTQNFKIVPWTAVQDALRME